MVQNEKAEYKPWAGNYSKANGWALYCIIKSKPTMRQIGKNKRQAKSYQWGGDPVLDYRVEQICNKYVC